MKAIQLAKVLAGERHRKGISQEELAAHLGVSKAAVSKWENEQSFPDITLLPLIAAYFNISIDELMGYQAQLTKEEIQKQYFYFANAFETETFEQVLAECQEQIKKYYCCYPFLMHMAVLLINHANCAENFEEIMEYAIELLEKVKTESDNANDIKEAIDVEATCYLMLNRPQEVLSILNEEVRPISQDTELLAQAYQGMGNVEKAKEVTQIAMYQHLLMLIGDGASYLLLHAQEYDTAEIIMKRTDQIVEAFEVNKLHPNVMASYYISCAQVCCMNGKEAEALEAIRKYVDLCITDFFSFTLHGDLYFDKIEGWFQEFELGKRAPRGEKSIKQSLISAICDNPCFEAIKEKKEFQNLEKRLKSHLEAESGDEKC